MEPQNFNIIVTTESPSPSILLSDVVMDLHSNPDDSSPALLRVGGAELREEQRLMGPARKWLSIQSANHIPEDDVTGQLLVNYRKRK